MSIMKQHDPDYVEFYRHLDSDDAWKSHRPEFAWTQDDLDEFEHDLRCAEMERLAMAAWWELEGVRSLKIVSLCRQNHELLKTLDDEVAETFGKAEPLLRPSEPMPCDPSAMAEPVPGSSVSSELLRTQSLIKDLTSRIKEFRDRIEV